VQDLQPVGGRRRAGLPCPDGSGEDKTMIARPAPQAPDNAQRAKITSARGAAGLSLILAAVLCGTCAAAPLPPDVRADSWAARPVSRTLKAGVLRVQQDGRFHGEARVSRSETAIALAALGRGLLQGTWSAPGKGKAVPDGVAAVWEKTDWKTAPVRRYTLAAVLERMADYVEVALKRPAPSAPVGKSEAIPPVPASRMPAGPSLEALKYLARYRMIQPDSPLLKPDGAPLTGAELSRAIAEFATGVNDRLTDVTDPADDDTAPKR